MLLNPTFRNSAIIPEKLMRTWLTHLNNEQLAVVLIVWHLPQREITLSALLTLCPYFTGIADTVLRTLGQMGVFHKLEQNLRTPIYALNINWKGIPE